MSSLPRLEPTAPQPADVRLGRLLALLALLGGLAAGPLGGLPAGPPLPRVPLGLLALSLACASGLLLVPRWLERIPWRGLESLSLFRLTRLGLVIIVLLGTLSMAAVNSGNNLLLLVVCLLLALVLVSGTLSSLLLSGIAVRCRFPAWIHAGETVRVLWQVRNDKRRVPALALQLEMHAGGRTTAGGTRFGAWIPFLPPGRRCTVSAAGVFGRRGVYRAPRLELTSRSPFGFFRRGRVLRPAAELVVFPQVLPLASFPDVAAALGSRRELFSRGEGDSLYQVRDYRSGDAVRHVHWPSTARTGRLVVRDFSALRQGTVEIVLDNTRDHPSFEEGVRLAASLVLHFDRQGSRVSLVTASGRWDPPGSPSRRLRALLTALAEVEPLPAGDRPAGTLPSALAMARRDVDLRVILSPASSASFSPRGDARCCVIPLDRL